MTTEYTIGSIRQLVQDTAAYASARKAIREAAGKLPEPDPGPPRCKACRYFDEIHESIDHGSCRISPPYIEYPNYLGAWPVVNKSDWCGEWELNVMKTKEGGE